ncbi:hypothetical protein HMN09_01204600 [Mycena chlorophos]|uniref:Uncharacterized protein n=1 Tax=Mycena chlorophos TaxID=658473 RepID=A0A8H6S7L1_MYCCL|nr:hypothetical protein HMN09_01204600 [Mycena chlorophos]
MSAIQPRFYDIPLEPASPSSIHQYELPAENYLPPEPADAASLLRDISMQLFALGYNVERFMNTPMEDRLASPVNEMTAEVWNFLGEVLYYLPRGLKDEDIVKSRMKLYETLTETERGRPMVITEQVNPGADLPDPVYVEATMPDGEIHKEPVPIEAVLEGNSYIGNNSRGFTLSHSALAGTDAVDYVVEFIPDEPKDPTNSPAPRALVDEVDLPQPKLGGKAATNVKKSKKGKEKAVDAVDESVEVVQTEKPRQSTAPAKRGHATTSSVSGIVEESVPATSTTTAPRRAPRRSVVTSTTEAEGSEAGSTAQGRPRRTRANANASLEGAGSGRPGVAARRQTTTTTTDGDGAKPASRRVIVIKRAAAPQERGAIEATADTPISDTRKRKRDGGEDGGEPFLATRSSKRARKVVS